MTTALRSVQEKAGARFGRFFGVDLPACFSSLEDEWRAARLDCALIDAGFRSLLRVTGSERAEFLQGMLTNEIVKRNPGSGTHAAYLTVQGRVVSDMRVYILDSEIWLDLPCQRRAVVKDTLERYIVADDVELVDDDAIMPLMAIEGPRSGDIIDAIAGARLSALDPLSHLAHSFEGGEVRVVAASHTGEKGFLMFGQPDCAPALWRSFGGAGGVAVGIEAVDVLRVEAGVPWCDRDMDESTLAPEVGLESAISYSKGCYLGQEVVERVAARGQVQRKLMGIVCDSGAIPDAGAKLLRDGEEVGVVTSAVRSMAKRKVISLAYLRRSCWEPGADVEIEGDGSAQVATLPFYVSAAA